MGLSKIKPFKAKKCKQCTNYFIPQFPLQPVCDYRCAIKYNRAKQEKKQLEDSKKKDKETKESLKTPSDFKKDLEVEINHIVRLIDKGHECISSKATKYIVNAGHLYSVGAFPALRFNLLNIYAQSVHDNKDKYGNGVIYKERIKEVFGNEVSEEIENLKILYPELKLSIPELKEAIVKARVIVKYLKKLTEDQIEPFTTKHRILIRRRFNDTIGIYSQNK